MRIPGSLCIAGLFLAGVSAQRMSPAAGVAPVFQPAPAGCATIHCDVRMSNNVRMMPPLSANPVLIAHDPVPTGSGNPYLPAKSPNQGAGCVSNGRMAVCSYNNSFGDNVVAYNPDGTRIWASGNLLDSSSFASVPMISSGGDVIAADDKSVIRFSPTGAVIWNTPTTGGTPISPVVTQSGTIVLATKGGPVSAYDSTDGHLIGTLYIKQNPGDTNFFDTTNTPCVVNNRVYISTALQNDPANTAWLAAVDVDAANVTAPLQLAWHFTFGAPSYASDVCVGSNIYFDGGRVNPGDPAAPQMFAVRDNGATGSLLWVKPAPSGVAGSMARDPRGGVWVQFLNNSTLQRRSLGAGALLETLNITNLVNDPYPNIPMSVMSITGDSTRPIMIVGTVNTSGLSSNVIAVDLNTRAALWQFNIKPTVESSDNTLGEFPVVLDANNRPVLVFSGRAKGAYFLADPPAAPQGR